jgi:hypothetical protein
MESEYNIYLSPSPSLIFFIFIFLNLLFMEHSIIIFGGTTANLDFDHLSAENNNPTYEFYPKRYGGHIHSAILDWAYPHNLYPISFQLPKGDVFLFVSNRTLLVNPNIDPGVGGMDNLKSLPEMPPSDHAPFIYP